MSVFIARAQAQSYREPEGFFDRIYKIYKINIGYNNAHF